MSTTVLDEILARTRVDLEQRKRELPIAELAGGGKAAPAEGLNDTRRLRDALTAPGISVIAEFKRRSPSAGRLRDEADLEEIVRAYARGSCCAVGPHRRSSL